MSETATRTPDYSPWEETPVSSAFRPSKELGSAAPVESLQLPSVQPGQLWLVELPAISPEFAPLEYRTLTTANVVVYDEALAATVARYLPLGGYAEPAGPMAAERCIRFVRDGWSVARVIVPRGLSGLEATDEFRQLAARLLTLNGGAGFSLSAFVNNGGGAYRRSRVRLQQLQDVTPDKQRPNRFSNVTFVFEPFGIAATTRFSVASANGLAG